MRAVILLLLLMPAVVFAGDRWVPYTDGRAGGCAVSNNGSLYGCTPQPAAPPDVVYAPRPAPAPEVVYVPQPSEPRVVERTTYVPVPPAPVYSAAPAAPPAYNRPADPVAAAAYDRATRQLEESSRVTTPREDPMVCASYRHPMDWCDHYPNDVCCK
jgi:hypothetical protein